MGYDGIEKPRNPLQWMLGEIDGRMGRVLDHSFTDLARDGSKHDRGVVYAAVVTDDATVEGVVALFFEETEIVDGKSTTYLMLKIMGEDEEPLMDECPTHLLDLMTPVEDDDPVLWRNRCRYNAGDYSAPTMH